jgi:AcrR family transcriptional regulator
MPRIAMKDTEVEEIKKKILDTAFEIVYKEGFSNLSMRKIASKLKMTAANIYNYYSNKDELNIEMRRYGYLILYDNMIKAYERAQSIEERASLMIHEFVSFGIKNPNYYELMFNMPTPKYSDYVGTPMEELATREFTSSMRVFELAQKTTKEFVESAEIKLIDLDRAIIIILSFMHGIITLYNSRLLKNINAHPEKMVEELVLLVIEVIRDIKNNEPVKELIEKLEKALPGKEHHPAFKE